MKGCVCVRNEEFTFSLVSNQPGGRLHQTSVSSSTQSPLLSLQKQRVRGMEKFYVRHPCRAEVLFIHFSKVNELKWDLKIGSSSIKCLLKFIQSVPLPIREFKEQTSSFLFVKIGVSSIIALSSYSLSVHYYIAICRE